MPEVGNDEASYRRIARDAPESAGDGFAGACAG